MRGRRRPGATNRVEALRIFVSTPASILIAEARSIGLDGIGACGRAMVGSHPFRMVQQSGVISERRDDAKDIL